MKIGILTYDKPHKKTQKIILGLIKKGFLNLVILIIKFKQFKKNNKPLFPHRSYQFKGISPKKIAQKYNLEIRNFNIKSLNDLNYILIGGSQLINKKYIKKNFFINCHPGLIPFIRGLDSFKWAIHYNFQVGNSLHFIDRNVDLGKIIHQKKTPIFNSDTYKSFALRHYNEEISMLINFLYYLKNNKKFKLTKKNPKFRMDRKNEKLIIKKFKIYKKNYKID